MELEGRMVDMIQSSEFDGADNLFSVPIVVWQLLGEIHKNGGYNRQYILSSQSHHLNHFSTVLGQAMGIIILFQ